MTIQATINKLEEMKMYGMSRALKSAMELGFSGLGIDELLAHLIDAEYDDRQNRRLGRLLKAARFRYNVSTAEIDFCLTRNFTKDSFLCFSDNSWIQKKKNIIITGPTGVGKSFVASALGNHACIYGHATLYYNTQKLFSSLKLKKADGSYLAEIKKIAKAELLILDDLWKALHKSSYAK